MDVSKLSEIELNRAMIWCYPPEHRKYDPFRDNGKWCHSGSYQDTIHYDYLEDWNLTMPLAYKNGLSIEMPDIDFDLTDLTGSVTKHLTGATDLYCDFIGAESPLRAICEVLVLIALEKKNG